nr:uncharacterized protein LOC109159949 [Ipomoea batatas]
MSTSSKTVLKLSSYHFYNIIPLNTVAIMLFANSILYLCMNERRAYCLNRLIYRKFAEIHGGCFGVGDIEPPVCDGAQLDAGGVEAYHSDDYSDGSHPPTPCEHGPKKTAVVAIPFLDLAQLLKYGNPIDFQGEVYRQMHEASQLLFGIKHPPSCVVPDVSHPIEPTFSQRDDLFWKNAENLRADFRDDGCAGADNIVREVSSPRFDRSGHMDPVPPIGDAVPSVGRSVSGFAVCLTQDCRDDRWTDVDKIAHKYSSNVVDRSGHTDGVVHNADVQVAEDVRVMDMCTHSSLVDTPTDASPLTGDDVPSSGLGAKCPQFVTPNQAMSLTCVLVSGRDDIIFKSHGRYARWDDVLSLVLGSHVHIAIIDAWACLLNCREARKDFAALTRFFASAFFMVLVDTSRSRDQRIFWFRERFKLDLESSPYRDIGKVDLEDMLAAFFENSHSGRSIICADLDAKRMQMRWRDSKNKIDYGVCVMRHMESYVGQAQKKNNQATVKLEKMIDEEI